MYLILEKKRVMIIEPKKIRPVFTQILTTMYKYPKDMTIGGVIDTTRRKGDVCPYQKVVAVGNAVRTVEKGEWIQINPMRYAHYKHEKGSLKDGVIKDNPVLGYNFPVVEIGGEKYMLLDERDITVIIEDYDEVKFSDLVVPETIV